MLKLFKADNIDANYLGGYAVVLAQDKGHARRVLLRQLEAEKLPQKNPETIRIEPIDTTSPKAVILFNGDY